MVAHWLNLHEPSSIISTLPANALKPSVNKLGQFPMLETCEKWSVCKQLRLLCSPDPWKLSDTALLSGFESSRLALKSTESDSN